MNTGTLVLVHGSWGGGWVWDEVAWQLRAEGWQVLTPTLGGLSERAALLSEDTDHETHAADLLQAIGSLSGVVLVGHSYGALVASVAAARIPQQVRKLVTLDGFLAVQGRSLFDLHPELQPMLEANLVAGSRWQVAPVPAAAFGIADGPAAARYAQRSTPMPLASHSRPVRDDLAPLAALERHYLRCTGFPVFAQTAATARQQGWRCRELDAGHMVMLSDPGLLAKELALIAAG